MRRRKIAYLEEAEIQGRYGQIEIECGGPISGDLPAQPSSEHGEIIAEVPSVRIAS
jgi:hypothetical protein